MCWGLLAVGGARVSMGCVSNLEYDVQEWLHYTSRVTVICKMMALHTVFFQLTCHLLVSLATNPIHPLYTAQLPFFSPLPIPHPCFAPPNSLPKSCIHFDWKAHAQHPLGTKEPSQLSTPQNNTHIHTDTPR